MATKVKKTSIKREPGYLYFVSKEGNVLRSKMRTKNAKKMLVAATKIKKEKGYFYFVDKDGDVSRAAMKRK